MQPPETMLMSVILLHAKAVLISMAYVTTKSQVDVVVCTAKGHDDILGLYQEYLETC